MVLSANLFDLELSLAFLLLVGSCLVYFFCRRNSKTQLACFVVLLLIYLLSTKIAVGFLDKKTAPEKPLHYFDSSKTYDYAFVFIRELTEYKRYHSIIDFKDNSISLLALINLIHTKQIKKLVAISLNDKKSKAEQKNFILASYLRNVGIDGNRLIFRFVNQATVAAFSEEIRRLRLDDLNLNSKHMLLAGSPLETKRISFALANLGLKTDVLVLSKDDLAFNTTNLMPRLDNLLASLSYAKTMLVNYFLKP